MVVDSEVSEELLEMDLELKPESLEETIDQAIDIEPEVERLAVSLEAESAPVEAVEFDDIDFSTALDN